jgi:hypothetical protein
MTKFLPGFKVTYLVVGFLHIVLALSLFLRGLMPSMAEFKVPASTLESPHYYDAIFWVYTHMIILGSIILLMGILSPHGNKFKIWMSRFLFLAHAFYTYLDFKASDSFFGSALYQGPASVIPAWISLAFTLLFLQLSLRKNLET